MYTALLIAKFKIRNLRSLVLILSIVFAGSSLYSQDNKKIKFQRISSENFKLEKDDFVEKSNEIHNNFYDYFKSDFTTVASKVIIICPIHGDFPQTPNNHLKGVGCPTCSSSKGEKKISKLLDDFGINYIKQKKFKDCKDKNCLSFDFYLPNHNIIIEYDGRQHFESFEIFGGYEKFLITKKHDEIKNEYCRNKNIKLIRISYKDNINEIININFKK